MNREANREPIYNINSVNINPGLKSGLRQPYTIMMEGRIFFLTQDESSGAIDWNMFMDDDGTREKVEQILKNYLTNR
jgi:hypothetical protein